MNNFLALLRSVNSLAQIDALMPEMPTSPYLLEEIQKRKTKRIRHKKTAL